MSQLPAEQAISRFKENEERVDVFVNELGAYQSSGGPSVETLRSFIARKDVEVNQRYSTFNSRGDWTTATAYLANDLVKQDGVVYLCLIAHTAGSFATDLSSKKWAVHQGATRAELSSLSLSSEYTQGAGDATADTIGLQTQLNSKGLVIVSKDGGGAYILNDTIVVKSNTTIHFSPETWLRQAPEINKALITNECQTLPWNVITGNVFWLGGSGFDVLITWAGHNCQVGDAVWLDCEQNAQYCGIFTVMAVSGNDLTIILDREPTSNPNGVVRIKKADTNIEIYGLNLDYNATQNTSGVQSPNTHASIFAGIRTFKLKSVRGKDTKKYLVCTAGLADYEIDGVEGYNLNSDMVKIYGPSRDGIVVGLKGRPGDDTLSLQCREYDAFAPYRLSYGGDIVNIRTNVHMSSGEDGVAVFTSLYPTDWGGAIIDAITFEDYSGWNAGAGITVYQYEGEGGYIGTLKVKNFNARCKSPMKVTQSPSALSATKIKCIDFEMGPNCRAVTGDHIVQITDGAIVEDVIIRGANVTPDLLPSIGQGSLLALTGTGDVSGTITLDNVNWRVTTQFCLYTSGSAKSFKAINLNNCDIETYYDIVHGGALFSNNPSITVTGGRLKGTPYIFELQSACRITLLGPRLEPSVKLLTAYGNAGQTVYLDSVNSNLATGEWAIASGTMKIAPRSWDIVLNLEASWITREAGNKMITNTLSGTIPAGSPCICDGTGAANSWHGIADPVNHKK